MAKASELTCQQAQQLMHRLLDRRWTQPTPASLQRHFQRCDRCSSWLTLLDYEPIDLHEQLPADFSDRIINAIQSEKFRRRRPVRALVFASAAAAILLAVLTSYFFLPQLSSTNSQTIAQKDVRDLLPVLLTVKQEIEQVPQRVQQFQPPSFDLLAALPEVEWQIPNDPLTGTMPSVKALGTTLQGAIEPIETPAKEAYQKVKMIMHDPSLRKWLDSVTSGAM